MKRFVSFLYQIFFLLLTICFASSALFASTPDTLWTKIYGNSGYDCFYSMNETRDDGYILTGQSTVDGTGNNNIQIRLTKIDKNGGLLWDKNYGGPFSSYRFQK